jgi:hypothetical protein
MERLSTLALERPGADLNAVAQLLMLPAYSFWSLSLFAIDIVIVYGLLEYGGRRPEAVSPEPFTRFG